MRGVYRGRPQDRDREITEITTDSRKAKPGCLFAAIKGERADGHDFIPSVFEKGALCVLSEHELPGAAGNYIQVDSTLEALKALAEYYLRQLQIRWWESPEAWVRPAPKRWCGRCCPRNTEL